MRSHVQSTAKAYYPFNTTTSELKKKKVKLRFCGKCFIRIRLLAPSRLYKIIDTINNFNFLSLKIFHNSFVPSLYMCLF